MSSQSDAAAPRVCVPGTRVHRLASRYAEAEFELWIAEPAEPLMPRAPGIRPVLYVLDANLFFGTAVEMTRIMSRLYGELPPTLVVGVAHPTEDPALQAELRTRDFTPTGDVPLPTFPGAPPPTLPPDRRMGRAGPFLDFLVEEAMPHVRAHHPDADGPSVLWGSSLGGLFVLYAWLQRPGTFDACVAVSPALWWDDEALFGMEERCAASGTHPGGRLFLAVGGLEERADVPMLARFRMVTNVRRFAEVLRSRSYPSLDLATLVAEGESHTSVVPVGLTRGLRHALGPR